MKVIIALTFLFSSVSAFAGCMDFTGKYQDPDTTNPLGNIEIRQSGCGTLTHVWHLPDGTSSSVTVNTDGKMRRSCQNGHCFLAAYTQTSDSFKGIEIHQDGERLRYSNNNSVKLNDGNMEVTNQFVNWDGNEWTRKTVWKLIP